jgi:glucose-1-phosphate thymidylyltransferase
MKAIKGIILAGGKATRLYPSTKVICKQLLPVYDKPLIYYPLSVLMLANIKDILIITTPQDRSNFERLLGDGSSLGIRISYEVQAQSKGIADAFLVGEKFIGQSKVALILGDNIFYGDKLGQMLRENLVKDGSATIFCYSVSDPSRYGVLKFNQQQKPIEIIEKPKVPPSNWAVTGLYFYDNDVVKVAKTLKPSARGELEITDINRQYLKRKKLKVKFFSRGFAWLDTGTHDSLLEASQFIKIVEDRQGLKIGCIEEVAYRMGFISKAQLSKLTDSLEASYTAYLRKICES